jgi:hypothetical protein
VLIIKLSSVITVTTTITSSLHEKRGDKFGCFKKTSYICKQNNEDHDNYEESIITHVDDGNDSRRISADKESINPG